MGRTKEIRVDLQIRGKGKRSEVGSRLTDQRNGSNGGNRGWLTEGGRLSETG